MCVHVRRGIPDVLIAGGNALGEVVIHQCFLKVVEIRRYWRLGW